MHLKLHILHIICFIKAENARLLHSLLNATVISIFVWKQVANLPFLSQSTQSHKSHSYLKSTEVHDGFHPSVFIMEDQTIWTCHNVILRSCFVLHLNRIILEQSVHPLLAFQYFLPHHNNKGWITLITKHVNSDQMLFHCFVHILRDWIVFPQ